MEEELIDSFAHYPEGKGNQTITLFIISTGLIILMFVSFALVDLFRFSEILYLFTAICGIAAFALSIAGINVGLSERKYSSNWVKTGLIGHLVIVIVPILFIISLILYLI